MTTVIQLSFRCAATLLLLIGAQLGGVSKATAQHIIDFTKGKNLRQVYDAGLRPWRIRPDERNSLKVTDQQIRIIAPGAAPFVLDVEIGDFKVLAGNDLSSADFISQPMGLSQGIAKTREMCAALGVKMTGFDEKASQLLALGNQTPAPQYWNGRGVRNDVRFSVTLNPLFGINETRGKVIVTFEFHPPGKPMKFLKEPIKPPSGYEHLSLERPKSTPGKPFPNPAFGFDKMKKRIDDMKAAEDRSAAPPVSPISPPAAPVESPSPVVESHPPEPSSSWFWTAAVAIVIAGAAGVIFRSVRR